MRVEYSHHAEKRLLQRGITKAQVTEAFNGDNTIIEAPRNEFTLRGSDKSGRRIKVGYLVKPDGTYFIRTVASPDDSR